MFGSSFACAVRWRPSGRPAGLHAERGCADCAAAARDDGSAGTPACRGKARRETATDCCLRLAFAGIVLTG
eukprot:6398816-Heterocapsa_arctica.AAC.1